MSITPEPSMRDGFHGAGLRQLLLRRILVIVGLGLVLSLTGAWIRARSEVHLEGVGAEEAGQLAQSLVALQHAPDDALPGLLAQLQWLNDSGQLRHMQIEVRDPANTVRVHPHPAELPVWRSWMLGWLNHGGPDQEASVWHVARQEGPWQIKWLPNPVSDQSLALNNLLYLTAILLGISLAVMLGVAWALRKAMNPLGTLLRAVSLAGRERGGERLPRLQLRELDQIAAALNRLADELDLAEEQRRLLSLKVLTLQEQERMQLARELHDQTGQYLTAMRADLAWMLRKLPHDHETREVCQGLAMQADRLQQEVRSLLQRLNPLPGRAQEPPLVPGASAAGANGAVGDAASIRITEALEDLMQGWRASTASAGVELTLSVTPRHMELPTAMALGIYRMSQEALTNVIRHACATAAQVVLHFENDRLVWQVSDNGVGLPSESGRRGSGLAGIQERVWAHRGQLQIQSSDAGLTLKAEFSLGQTGS